MSEASTDQRTGGGQTLDLKPGIAPEENGKSELLQQAIEIAHKSHEELNPPQRYNSIDAALSNEQITQRAEIKTEKGRLIIADPESGKRIRFLRDLASDLVQEGPKYLKNFQVEARVKNGTPVIICSYDLNDRYQIVICVSEPYDHIGERISCGLPTSWDFSYGKVEAHYLIDRTKTHTGVMDLRHISSNKTEHLVGADEHDYRGQRLKRVQGNLIDGKLSFRLITTLETMATFLHENGHDIFHHGLKKHASETGDEFLELYEAAKTEIGGLPNREALKALLIDEGAASEIGKKAATFLFGDEETRQAVSDHLDSISERYAAKIAKVS